MEMEASYNWFLVVLSFLISVFGAFTGLQMTNGMKASGKKFSWGWITAAAFALGGGAIWTMHFIGMLAYQLPMDMGYDPWLTFLSLIVAVLAVGLGVATAVAGHLSWPRLLGAGVLTGLGVASMHYIGMAAMVMPGEMHYDQGLVAVSIGIALVAATVALWLAVNLKGTMQILLSAVVMAVAVCGMHYTGMVAMTMEHEPGAATNQVLGQGMAPMTMGLLVFCTSMVLLVLCLIASLSQLNQKMQEELGVLETNVTAPSN
ncbi:MHYT domain-containing protein [Marinimicrobium locisalis]|uniref:MHYT domain-containing protein n=1 Tax=Marinimicrobium locisalis TaxID=546022 RepID=UPI0032217F5B